MHRRVLFVSWKHVLVLMVLPDMASSVIPKQGKPRPPAPGIQRRAGPPPPPPRRGGGAPPPAGRPPPPDAAEARGCAVLGPRAAKAEHSREGHRRGAPHNRASPRALQ